MFDSLYKIHSNKLIKKFTNPRRVSEYKSENIIYELINDIFDENNLSHLSLLLHYPLRKLINDFSIMNKEEIKYAGNNLTHVDFLIYNNITKKPVLVVEVDGYAYHNMNEKQLRRDRLKDEILSKYKIRLVRLNTTGSNEKEMIKIHLE